MRCPPCTPHGSRSTSPTHVEQPAALDLTHPLWSSRPPLTSVCLKPTWQDSHSRVTVCCCCCCSSAWASDAAALSSSSSVKRWGRSALHSWCCRPGPRAARASRESCAHGNRAGQRVIGWGGGGLRKLPQSQSFTLPFLPMPCLLCQALSGARTCPFTSMYSCLNVCDHKTCHAQYDNSSFHT